MTDLPLWHRAFRSGERWTYGEDMHLWAMLRPEQRMSGCDVRSAIQIARALERTVLAVLARVQILRIARRHVRIVDLQRDEATS